MQSDLDLASLLASRLCHDVVGPVGAIQNGLELIAEDKSMTDMAMELIKKSAAQATAKLQYARMAYGAAGGAAELDPAEAGRLTAAMFEGERATLSWDWTGPPAPRNPVKLAMLFGTFALGAVPRGGEVRVNAAEDGHLNVVASGSTIRTPPFMELLVGGGASEDPRAIQAVLMQRLAEENGWRIFAAPGDTEISWRTSQR
ncbi:MAG: histidine phosphotransferase family protein [Pseudomonadota bacterium]